jgi:hypothetical protein
MNYKPKPLCTDKVELDQELLALSEKLAEIVHDLWAMKRFSEGWKLGLERNDVLREHPSLIPYRELPEQEKEYDRQTALGTIKAIIALGYRIEKTDRLNYR